MDYLTRAEIKEIVNGHVLRAQRTPDKAVRDESVLSIMKLIDQRTAESREYTATEIYNNLIYIKRKWFGKYIRTDTFRMMLSHVVDRFEIPKR